MKEINDQPTLRITIAAVLCLSILFYAPLRASVASTVVAIPPLEVKSESQFRTEASRYAAAVKAIGEIATMKLETADDLRKAVAILDRERPNLKFHFSKLVVMSVSDSTFSNAVKKGSPDRAAAESLIKQMAANPKAVLTIDGADSLKTRLRRSDESDAAVLRRAGERLKGAAERLKGRVQGRISPKIWGTEEFKVIHAGFTQPSAPTNAPLAPQDPGTIAAAILIGLIVIDVVLYGAIIIKNVSTEQGRDLIAECQENSDNRYLRCIVDANFLQKATCYASWLIDQAACLVTPG